MLIAIEGIDQSGKATLAAALAGRVEKVGLTAQRLAFPDYGTPVGKLIGAMLHKEIAHNSMLMQLLCAANRFEKRERLENTGNTGSIVICDRYTASALAYGKANGVPTEWLRSVESPLPRADATILLDVDPVAARDRKVAGRDRYESDIELLKRVRETYREMAAEESWIVLDGARDRDAVADEAWKRTAEVLGIGQEQRSAGKPEP